MNGIPTIHSELEADAIGSVIAESNRLRIRKLTHADSAFLFELLSDETVMKYSLLGPHSAEQVETFIERNTWRYENDGFSLWGVELKETGELIGTCGLVVQGVGLNSPIELGYRFLPRFWGKGYAAESAIACLAWGFQNLEVDRIVSLVEPENQAALHLAQKIGMKRDDLVLFHDIPVEVHSIERDQFSRTQDLWRAAL